MIMPCMNSTSARESWGTDPVVEGGSVLVGAPGAPGSTTFGGADCACPAYAALANRAAETVTAGRTKSTAAFRPELTLHSRSVDINLCMPLSLILNTHAITARGEREN